MPRPGRNSHAAETGSEDAPGRVDLLSVAHPLDLFYTQAGVLLPPIQEVEREEMPQPYRGLLAHGNDMTPTLEAFYGDTLELEVMGHRREGDEYFREVILRLQQTHAPVEFGANRVRLDFFPAEARRLILEEKEPLGHIMRDYDVRHTCQPNAFFRVASDSIINRALGLEGAHVLYGRHNRLFNLDGQLISEVVEILHPADERPT